ncbi:MAG: TIGR04255 family protein [Myxococcota bacterium]
MGTEHETFENAPIDEAVIDLHVTRGPGSADEALQAFVDSVRAEYPSAHRRIDLSITVGPEQDLQQATAPAGWLLRSPDHPWVVLPRVEALAVSRIRPYTSWTELEGRTREVWTRYVELTKPERVSRIATRFINRIVLPAGEARWDEWFTTGVHLGAGLPGEIGEFLIQMSLESEGATATVVIKKETVDPLGRTPVFFDIDAATVGTFAPDDPEIWSKLDVLRRFKNAIFFGSLTERTKEMFR